MCGGKRPQGPEFAKGWFFEPTIFDNVKPSMRIAREEIFGPVLSVIPFRQRRGSRSNRQRYGVWSGGGCVDSEHQPRR